MSQGESAEDKRDGSSASHVKGLGVLAFVAVVGTVLRGYHVGNRSLWFDEAFSWRLSQFPLPELLDRAMRDNNPPLYYVLLKGWIEVFGETAVGLRSLSVFMGTISIVGAYLFCVEAFKSVTDESSHDDPASYADPASPAGPREIGLWSAALVATSAMQIRWAWEARMYALGAALVMFSSWALLRAINRRTVSAWIVYAILAALFLYSHSYAIFTVAGQVLFIAGLLAVQRPSPERRANVRGAVTAAVVMALAWAPWVPVLRRQHAQVTDDFWSRPLEFLHVRMSFYEMAAFPEDAPVWPWLGTFAMLACAALWVSLLSKGSRGTVYLFCISAVPFLLAVNVSLLGRNIFHLRYLTFINIGLLVAVAGTVCRIPYPLERRLLAGWLVFISLAASINFHHRLQIPQKPGGRMAVGLMNEQRHPGEPVIVCSPLLYYSLLFYSSEREGWKIFDDGRSPRIHYYGSAILEPDNLITQDQLSNLPAGRVWIADMADGYWGRHTVPVPRPWRLIEERAFPEVYRVQGNVIVRLFQVPAVEASVAAAETTLLETRE